MLIRQDDEIIAQLSPLMAKHNSRVFKVVYKIFEMMTYEPEDKMIIDDMFRREDNYKLFEDLIKYGYLMRKRDNLGHETSIIIMTPKGNELYFKMHDVCNAYKRNKMYDHII